MAEDAPTQSDLNYAAEQIEQRAREAEKAKFAFQTADHALQCAKSEMGRLIALVSPKRPMPTKG